MLPIIYFTFTRYTGLYFWSMIASTVGVLVYATGFGTRILAPNDSVGSYSLALEDSVIFITIIDELKVDV